MRKVLTHCLSLLCICLYSTVNNCASAQLSARFSSNVTTGCAPLLVRFTDESTGNPTWWKWDLGNGTISYFQHPAATFFNPGIYTVKLVVKNATQTDSVIKTKYITVYASPLVNFSASDTTGCYPLNVRFTDLSLPGDGNVNKWLWDFGDGSTDSVQNPKYIYRSPGNFNVSLQVKTSFGCSGTITRQGYIKLNMGVRADFTHNVAINCKPPTAVSFTNHSTGTGSLEFQWLFGDGQTSQAINPVHIYNNPGTYTVKLIVRNSSGCIDTLVKNQAIRIGNVAADFILPSPVCSGQNFNIINTSDPNPTTSYWTFGDGTSSTDINPNKIYPGAGSYTIKLISDFGSCKDSISRSVNVLSKPATYFSADNTKACRPPLKVNFNNITTGAVSYKWFFGDGDSSLDKFPIHTYNKAGDFTVVLIAYNAQGCSDTLAKSSFVQIKAPVASITNLPQEGCVPFHYNPQYSIQSVDSITSLQWNFGDGATALGPNPSHTYTNQGIYSVTLIVSTAGGCNDTIIMNSAIHTGIKPAPAFAALPRVACAIQPIKFTDLTIDPAGDHWLWYFGDGGTSTEKNPSHLYQDTGFFDVKLIVSNNGCKDSLQLNRYIQIKPPIAKFTDTSDCSAQFTTKFIDKSIGAISWYWDFGDGSTSTQQNPIHIYSSAGAYLVQLTVKNDTCEHFTSQTIRIIHEKADFIASDTSVCKGTAIDFKTKNVTIANISSFQWDFGDGTSQYGDSEIVHQYNASGQYTVRLIIRDNNGCADTLLKPFYIHVYGPAANFDAVNPSACISQNVSFNDLSATDEEHKIKIWIWNYGDGIIDTILYPPFIHHYSSSGNYTVALKVIDTKNCADSTKKNNIIFISSPKANFNSTDTLSCANTSIHFSNFSTGQLLIYTWRFGDGNISSLENPIHNYLNEGTYSVNLSVKDQYGCSDSLVKNNYVTIKNPKAKFSVSDSISTCPPLVVNFTNQSSNYISYQWYFGDSTSSSLENPLHFYTYPGIYKSKLVVTSAGGCKDSITKFITVRGPQGSFTYDKLSGCVPTTVKFTATTKDRVAYIWDFNDGATIITGDSVILHTYDQMSDYLPKMILRDPEGCQVPIVGKDTIKIFGAHAKFGSDRNIVCDSGTVYFRDSSLSNDQITNYDWTFGDGSSSNSQNALHIYRTTGVFPVSLSISTKHFCKDIYNSNIPLKVIPSPIAKITGDTAKCIPAVFQFNGTPINPDTSAMKWKWDFGNNSTSALQNPDPVTYNSAGSYNVSLIVTNSTNCSSTSFLPIITYPRPVVNSQYTAVICRGQSTDLFATGAINYKWSPETGLLCAICAATKAKPDSTTWYYVNGSNNFGCTANDSVLITVKQPFKIRTGPGDTLCKGNSFRLSVSGAELYNWSPSNGLDNPASANPKAQPDSSVLYRVIGLDDHNCFSDTGYIPIVIYPYPKVNVGGNQTITGGTSAGLQAIVSNDVKNIKWEPGTWLSCTDCVDPVANPKQTTKYRVEVKNQGGCIAKADLTVFVICGEGNLFMPNTFSPNGDGINDVFYPRGKGITGIKNFRVFNRWGEVVFEQSNFQPNDASKGWNGIFRDRMASQDVYVYTIEVICDNNVTFSYKGNVALVR